MSEQDRAPVEPFKVWCSRLLRRFHRKPTVTLVIHVEDRATPALREIQKWIEWATRTRRS